MFLSLWSMERQYMIDVRILAAGKATRFGVDAQARPKCMMPIGDSTILAHLVAQIRGLSSFADVTVVTRSMFSATLRDALPRRDSSAVFTVIGADTAGSLATLRISLEHRPPRGRYIVLTSDVVFLQRTLRDFEEFAMTLPAGVMGIGVTEFVSDVRPAFAMLDEDHKVLDFGKDVCPTGWVSASCFAFDDRASGLLREARDTVSLSRFIASFVRVAPAHALAMGKTYDIDDPSDLDALRKDPLWEAVCDGRSCT